MAASVLVVVPWALLVVVPCAVVVDSTDDEVVGWVDAVVPDAVLLVVPYTVEAVVVGPACAGEPPEASSTPSGPISARMQLPPIPV